MDDHEGFVVWRSKTDLVDDNGLEYLLRSCWLGRYAVKEMRCQSVRGAKDLARGSVDGEAERMDRKGSKSRCFLEVGWNIV